MMRCLQNLAISFPLQLYTETFHQISSFQKTDVQVSRTFQMMISMSLLNTLSRKPNWKSKSIKIKENFFKGSYFKLVYLIRHQQRTQLGFRVLSNAILLITGKQSQERVLILTITPKLRFMRRTKLKKKRKSTSQISKQLPVSLSESMQWMIASILNHNHTKPIKAAGKETFHQGVNLK